MSRKIYFPLQTSLLAIALLVSALLATGCGSGDDSDGPGRSSSEKAGDEAQGGPGPWNARLGSRPEFVDVTAETGIVFVHENGKSERCRYPEIMGAGVGLFDYDGDGDLDLYFVNSQRVEGQDSPDVTNRLYRNLGGWRFEDVTDAAGVGDPGFGQGCCVGDYDRDGDLDLYVSNLGVNRLYQNRGDGTFVEVAEKARVADGGWGQSSAFLDYDGDGWLDLYVQNYLTRSSVANEDVYVWVGSQKVVDYPSPLGYKGQADRLFRNRGDGTFEDVTTSAGILRANGKGMGVGCADFDDDGHVDLFVANDTAENFLFRGRPGGKFEESGLAHGVAFNGAGVPEASMGVDVGDYDGDGRLDLIVPCLHRQVFTLYRNEGAMFSDVSLRAGLAEATAHSTGFNANFLDYDSDGDLDLFFTSGGVRRNEFASLDASYVERYGIPDILVANDGKGRFVDASRHAGPYFERAHIGRGSAVGDLDLDGDLDLVVCNLADRAVVLRNDTAGGHWITIELIDADGKRHPFAADVRITAGGRTQRRVQDPRVSYLSQSDLRLHFGLGSSTRIDLLEVHWPSGAKEQHKDLAADRFIAVREGAGISEILLASRVAREIRFQESSATTAEGDSVTSAERATDKASSKTTRKPPSAAALKNAEQRFQSGLADFRSGRYSDALVKFEQASKIDPTDPRPHHGRGEVYRKLFMIGRAEEAFRAAVDADPTFVESKKSLTKILHDAGEHREAVEILEPLASKYPRDNFLLGELAINVLALGDATRAIALLERYNAAQGRQAWGLCHLGRAHDIAGDTERAEAAYREALSIDPGMSVAHYWLGQLLVASGRDAESKTYLERYRRMRELENQEHQLRMTLLRNENHVPTMVQLARVLSLRGKRQECLRWLDRARKLAPDDLKLQELFENVSRSGPGDPPSR